MKNTIIIAISLILMTLIPVQALSEYTAIPNNEHEHYFIELQSLMQEASETDQVVSCQIVGVRFPEASTSVDDASAESLSESIIMVKDVFITSIAKGEIPSHNPQWSDRIDIVTNQTMPNSDKYELIVSAESLPLLLGPAENDMANCAEYRARFFSKSGVIEEAGKQYELSEPYMCIIYALHLVIMEDSN